MLVHVHALINAQQHCSCVCHRSYQYRRSHMCLLECNVCGGITAVVLSRCRSLYLTLCGSLWTSMAYQPSSGLPHTLWFLSLCVAHLSAVFIQHQVIVFTAQKVSPTSPLPAQSVAVSAGADRHSLCPHCQGYLSLRISIIPGSRIDNSSEGGGEFGTRKSQNNNRHI